MDALASTVCADVTSTLEAARFACPDSQEVSRALDVIAALERLCDGWPVVAAELHYIDGKPWRVVGAELGYSAVHVRRMVHRLLARAGEEPLET